jgi:hypothetical protein
MTVIHLKSKVASLCVSSFVHFERPYAQGAFSFELKKINLG